MSEDDLRARLVLIEDDLKGLKKQLTWAVAFICFQTALLLVLMLRLGVFTSA